MVMTLPLPVQTLVRQRYLIQQVLGQGGFARTYLAIDQERFQETCVIKEFVVAYQDETLVRKAKRLFQRESSILHQVNHQQIPQFLAAFEEHGRLFLVQDYVEGVTYRELQQKRQSQGGGFTEGEILHLLANLLPVLDYLHERKIIHRDISPDNIIIRPLLSASGISASEAMEQEPSARGLPILIDFGAVKEATSGLTLVSSMTRVGKVGYAPPEQLQTGNVQPHSDLYALAATCLVLLTNREPNTLLDSQTLAWNWEPYIHLSEDLSQILRKMLALHPGERYGRAREVWTDLDAICKRHNIVPIVKDDASWHEGAQRISPFLTEEETHRHQIRSNKAKLSRKFPLLPTIQERSHQTWQFWQHLSPQKALVMAGLATLTMGVSIFRQPALPSANLMQHEASSSIEQTNIDRILDNGKPHVIQFRTNEMSRVVQGNLQGNRVQVHTLKASHGQIMTADLKGSGVFMNIMRGAQLTALENSSYQTRNWTGTLPADDEYQIHITGSGAYSLEVSITPLNRHIPVETQHIQFPLGKSGTTVTGHLKAKHLQRYFVKAKRNKMMVISDVQGSVNIRVLTPKGEQIGGTSSTSPSWQGKISTDGDHVIEVTSGKDETPFALSVELF